MAVVEGAVVCTTPKALDAASVAWFIADAQAAKGASFTLRIQRAGVQRRSREVSEEGPIWVGHVWTRSLAADGGDVEFDRHLGPELVDMGQNAAGHELTL